MLDMVRVFISGNVVGLSRYRKLVKEYLGHGPRIGPKIDERPGGDPSVQVPIQYIDAGRKPDDFHRFRLFLSYGKLICPLFTRYFGNYDHLFMSRLNEESEHQVRYDHHANGIFQARHPFSFTHYACQYASE